MDATAYESAIRYPTDVKLLWEGCEWMYKKIKWWSNHLKIARPRNKYKDQKIKYLSYQRSRKKTHVMTVKRRNSLLYLLNKLIHQHDYLLIHQGITIHDLAPQYKKRLKTIIEVYDQQEWMIENGETSIKNRLVSIDKPYLHPIVRGKENKPVEFGAKVHMVQIGGINFMEHIAFEAYNESTRLINSVYMVRKYTGKCTHIAADAIYATNKNRSYCNKENIYTSFVRKGKAGPNEPQRSQMQEILSKDRSTRMEGSFGTEKNHYGLRRIMARTSANETVWIFFGIHTANICRIMDRIQHQKIKTKAA
jgi:hydrogenase maturation factor